MRLINTQLRRKGITISRYREGTEVRDTQSKRQDYVRILVFLETQNTVKSATSYY